MLVGNKHVGQQIIDYHKGRGMTTSTKKKAICENSQDEQGILIVAVAHLHRRPAYWQSRVN